MNSGLQFGIRNWQQKYDANLNPAESGRFREKRSFFRWFWGSIYRRRRLGFRSNPGRLGLTREGAHSTTSREFQANLWSIRNHFVSIRITSNWAQNWWRHSLLCVQPSVKISWCLDQWIERYRRYEMDFNAGCSARLHCFDSILSSRWLHALSRWCGARASLRSALHSESTASTPYISAHSHRGMTWCALFASIRYLLRVDRFDSMYLAPFPSRGDTLSKLVDLMVSSRTSSMDTKQTLADGYEVDTGWWIRSRHWLMDTK